MDILIRIRKDQIDKNGRAALYLQYIHKGKPCKMQLNEKVEVKYWTGINGEWIKQVGTHAHPNGRRINLLLSKKLYEANAILLDFKLNDKEFDWEAFKKIFKIGKGKNIGWTVAHNDFIKDRQKKKILSKNTMKGYRNRLKIVLEFQPNLTIDQVTTSFIDKFIDHLRNSRNNDTNSIALVLYYVRNVLKTARKNKLTSNNPFENIEIKTVKRDQPNLEFYEIELLEDLFDSKFFKKTKPGVYKVLRYFLFACYTGLDFGDILTLHSNHIKLINGIEVIDRKRSKNDRSYSVPISLKAKKYLPKEIKDGLIFNVVHNVTVNYSIKVCIKMCSIPKKVRFHTARHSFATMSLNLGVPLEILKQWMGHSSITMTEHYAKMNKSTSAKVVSIWNDFANKTQ